MHITALSWKERQEQREWESENSVEWADLLAKLEAVPSACGLSTPTCPVMLYTIINRGWMNLGVLATEFNLRWSMCCVYTQRGNPAQWHALLKSVHAYVIHKAMDDTSATKHVTAPCVNWMGVIGEPIQLHWTEPSLKTQWVLTELECSSLP